MSINTYKNPYDTRNLAQPLSSTTVYTQPGVNSTAAAAQGLGMDPVTGVMIGSAALQALGGLFNAKSANKQSAAAIAEQQRQFDLTRGDQQQRDKVNASQYDPLKQQKSRGNMAMMAAILPQLRNFQVNVPQGMQKMVPQMSGGLRLPEGGFGQDTLKFFSEGSRAGSEAEFLRNLGIPESVIDRILTNAGYGKAAVRGTLPGSTTPRQPVLRGSQGPGMRREPEAF